MLIRTLLLLCAALVACSSSSSDDRPTPIPQPRPYVAVHFYDERALIPEFRRLPPGDPADAIVALLLDGPRTPGLETAIPEKAELVSATEADEGLLLEMSADFWRGPPEELRRRAAQVVFTVAGIEEGRSVTLLDGLVPGRVPGTGAQPLDRDDFLALRPWIEVVQPVAGALVANPMPVLTFVRGGAPVHVEIFAGGEVVGRGRDDSVAWDTDASRGVVRITTDGHKVDVPVVFAR
ncbi:MAG: GerMN domain-containing protein [Actinomycetota bacterium]